MANIFNGFLHDLKFAARSLRRTGTLSGAVVLTLALGIGANAAMFSLVRGILLRPLVNRDEGRLIYIRQSANGRNALFSIPEIQDITSRAKTLNSFGDFSVLGFTMIGLGEPRTVRAGVVGGSYFEVMGLNPVLGRLLDAHDDGPNAAGAVVLTYRFWTTAYHRDASVIGKTVRLGSFVDSRPATVVGVLEPSVPYPQDTEIISNIVTSAHHLSATMVTGRIHRMTEVFARLAPGTSLQQASAELNTVYDGIKREHPEAYPKDADFHVSAVMLRDALTAPARTILLVLMAASLLVFAIACSNVANLILARNVRRESELAIRAALGASTMDLRRVLLAESLLLCVGGAAIGMLIAAPMVTVLARYASRYSVRALDLSMDWSMIWVGAGLAVLAAAFLAFVPRLPSQRAFGLTAGSSRSTGTATRKLKVFALVQVALCFVLLAASAATVNTLLSLESVRARFDTRHILAVNLPVMRDGRKNAEIVNYYREVIRQVAALPGVVNVGLGSSVPWRDRGSFLLEYAIDGRVPQSGEKHLRADYRVVSPGYFGALGSRVIAGRDFNDADTADSEPVAVVSESFARQTFSNGDAVGHHVLFTDPILRFSPMFVPTPRRIVGIVPDIDNTHLAPEPTMAVYHSFAQDTGNIGSQLVVESRTDPYALVQPITATVRNLYAAQPVEHASTLEDIRAEVLSPERLNAMVSGVFAGVALLIAIVGVGGVLAFSVSGRTREFGIRLAVGSQPRHLLMRVIAEGAAMAAAGLGLGLLAGYGLARLASTFVGDLKMPGILPLVASAVVLMLAAVTAAAMPAARAARIDVLQALRAE
jgi:putative ABC transport system permease protein